MIKPVTTASYEGRKSMRAIKTLHYRRHMCTQPVRHHTHTLHTAERPHYIFLTQISHDIIVWTRCANAQASSSRKLYQMQTILQKCLCISECRAARHNVLKQMHRTKQANTTACLKNECICVLTQCCPIRAGCEQEV